MSKETRHLVSPTAELRRSKCDRDAFAAKPRLPIIVVLDRVTQAYNIGSIFRLCDAMLAERLVIAGAEVDLHKRNLGQAACGTQFWTPWSQEKSAVEAVTRAKADGYQIAVVELASNSVRPEAFVPRFPVCLVLGGEFDGVSQEVVDLADAVIEIPMRGMANSINVSTAAAIVLYALSCRAEAEGSSVGAQQIKLPAPPRAPAS
jgi:tRNA G18 (ribose-2'-O)-methylase SpoU